MIEQGMYPNQYQPQICDKSKLLIEDSDFHRRNQHLLEKQFKLRNEEMSVEIKDCTF